MSRPTRRVRLIVCTISSCQAVKSFSGNIPLPDIDRHRDRHQFKNRLSSRVRTRSLLARNEECRHVACFRSQSRTRHQRYHDLRCSRAKRSPSSDDLDCIAVAASLTLSSWQRATSTAQADATKIARQSMAFADQNMAVAFEFAEKLIHTKHPIEVIQVQQQYLARQMQALSSQTRELSRVGFAALGSMSGLFHLPWTKD
jgi:Phasin protein